MLYWMCERTRNPPTEKQLEHAIKRNFGGLKELNTYKIFMTHLGNIDFTIPQEVSRTIKDFLLIHCFQNNHLFHPDCTPLGLIETSLRTKETTWHG